MSKQKISGSRVASGAIRTHALPAKVVSTSNCACAQRSVDHLLIERFNAGDLLAFEVLLIRYQFRVASLIDLHVRDPDVAEELTQHVFLRAFRALDNFECESPFSSWLFALVHEMATNYLQVGRLPVRPI